ncbi:MAG TPA: DUF934 domain-containing protein [Chloroflexota bacterium]|nr:DUF934 domain-containing protein [Chloroflexota bacterium]
MPDLVIRNGRVEPDTFEILPADAVDQKKGLTPILSLARWKERGGSAVWLGPADDPAELAAAVGTLEIVAVHFPKFTDGRGYSIGALLRTRHGFKGELRAFGDVGRDQLFYLRRCGFDAFRLADHRDPHDALASLADFTVRYQASVDDPVPLFRKRRAAA